MDELAFAPAPAAGKNLWPLASIPTLIAALGTDFGPTGQPGSTLPLIVDGVSFASAIPSAELPLYSSPSVVDHGLDETSQAAAAYTAALAAVACRPTVVELLLNRLVDGPAPGAQSGLFYADGTAKTSLSAVTQAVASAQGPTRACASASTSSPPTTPTKPSSGPSSAPTTTTTTPTPPPAVAQHTAAVAVAADDELVFPSGVSRSGRSSVRLGCTAACLYLVTLQRADDGAPILATRGELSHAGARTVTLPNGTVAAGSYRFSVWIVGQANPGPVTVARSPVVSAG